MAKKTKINSWNDDCTVSIDPCKNPKLITGTRFAAVLGQNKWKTPFATWCEITRVYEEDFEETKYTAAGKAIEPLQAEYMRRQYGMSNIKSPTDIYGSDYFKTTRGNFFSDKSKVFGGMWDYILVNSDGSPAAVLEMKTTKRSEDWVDDIPEYYALQAALYAHLLGVEDIYMVCSVLEDKDYDNPCEFKCNAQNTFVRHFKLNDRYCFGTIIAAALNWYFDHVVSGISPRYDEKKDAEVLKQIRTMDIANVDELSEHLTRACKLSDEINSIKEGLLKEKEKELKICLDVIKEFSKKQINENVNAVSIQFGDKLFITSTYGRKIIDTDKMELDGIDVNSYASKESTYKISIKNK